jgi:ribonuclease P/MRP protein subunit RPP1
MDLMVVLPSSSSSKKQQPSLLPSLLDRIETTGFTTVALTHLVYGSPQSADHVDLVFPDSMMLMLQKHLQKKRKNKPQLRVLKRLHAIVENLSDVGLYALKPDKNDNDCTQRILQSYDLVSLAPRNDAVFQAACVSATAAEILTLDYFSSNSRLGRLPFKVRTKDVKAAIQRGVVFEIPYAPAILHPRNRKAFVQTFRELQTASLGLKPKILLSSGNRQFGSEQEDVGALALRMPGDLINLLETVLHVDHAMTVACLTTSARFAVNAARTRRFGDCIVASVEMNDANEDEKTQEDGKNKNLETAVVDIASAVSSSSKEAPDSRHKDAGNEVCEDGFISF